MSKARELLELMDSMERTVNPQRNPKSRTIGTVGNFTLRSSKSTRELLIWGIPREYEEEVALTLIKKIQSVLSATFGNGRYSIFFFGGTK